MPERAGAPLRLRALALIHAAMDAAQVTEEELARRLGIARADVGETLTGDGNITLDELARYLAVLGYEVELVPAVAGELSASMGSGAHPGSRR